MVELVLQSPQAHPFVTVLLLPPDSRSEAEEACFQHENWCLEAVAGEQGAGFFSAFAGLAAEFFQGENLCSVRPLRVVAKNVGCSRGTYGASLLCAPPNVCRAVRKS